MKNIIAGYITTLIGFLIMLLSIAQFYGFVNFPTPEQLSPKWQIIIGFLTGITLFLVPSTVIEKRLKKLLKKDPGLND